MANGRTVIPFPKRATARMGKPPRPLPLPVPAPDGEPRRCVRLDEYRPAAPPPAPVQVDAEPEWTPEHRAAVVELQRLILRALDDTAVISAMCEAGKLEIEARA